MSSYTQILYQLVFTTKDRKNTMAEVEQEKKYLLWNIEPF